MKDEENVRNKSTKKNRLYEVLEKKDAGKEKKCLKVLDFQNVVPVAKGHERETEKLNKNEKKKNQASTNNNVKYLVLRVHIDSFQKLPLLLTQKAVDLAHWRKIELV